MSQNHGHRPGAGNNDEKRADSDVIGFDDKVVSVDPVSTALSSPPTTDSTIIAKTSHQHDELAGCTVSQSGWARKIHNLKKWTYWHMVLHLAVFALITTCACPSPFYQSQHIRPNAIFP
jgi:hypothetical protein